MRFNPAIRHQSIQDDSYQQAVLNLFFVAYHYVVRSCAILYRKIRRPIMKKEIPETDNTSNEKYRGRKVNYRRLMQLDQTVSSVRYPSAAPLAKNLEANG